MTVDKSNSSVRAQKTVVIMLNDAVSGILDLQGNWAVVLGSTLWFPKPAMSNKQERQ